jgi:hypothetical protein
MEELKRMDPMAYLDCANVWQDRRHLDKMTIQCGMYKSSLRYGK